MRIAVVLAMVTALTASCTTQKLWDATNPDARTSIPAHRVSEAELREKGVPYEVDARGNYHVGKTTGQRIGDHALRFFFTPATVVLDVAPAAALISAQLYLNELAIDSGGYSMPFVAPSPHCRNWYGSPLTTVRATSGATRNSVPDPDFP